MPKRRHDYRNLDGFALGAGGSDRRLRTSRAMPRKPANLNDQKIMT